MLACQAAQTVTQGLPPGIGAAIVLRDGQAWLIEGDARWKGENDGRDVTVLFYPGSAQSLALESDESNLLIRARAADAAEDTWPLPLPASGARFDPISETFDEITDPAILASAAAAIRVPAAGCGRVAVTRTDQLGVDLENAGLSNLALIDGVVMFATTGSTEGELPRLFRFEEGVARDVTAELLPRPGATLRVYADESSFYALQITAAYANTYRIALDGTVTLLHEATLTGQGSLDQSLHWPGSHVIIGRDASARTVSHLDADTGVWTRIYGVGMGPADVRCTPYLSNQTFVLDGPARGVSSFVDAPSVRFALGEPAQQIGSADPVTGCQSGYVRFGSGAEVMVVLADVFTSGAYDLRSMWRSSPDEPWQHGDFVAPAFDLFAVGEQAAGVDPVRDEVLLIGRDPRRPELRPRLCARLGLANVVVSTMQGAKGAALLREDARAPVYIAHYEVVAP